MTKVKQSKLMKQQG